MTNYVNITSGVKLIGLHGKAGSGKDTVCDFLIGTYKDMYPESFVGPLKKGLAEIFGIPLEHFEQRDIKEITNPYWDRSPRWLAQYFGTEVLREHIDEYFWIKRLALRLNADSDTHPEWGAYDSNDTVVISDVRFQNEYDWVIANQGIIIHLTRDGADGTVGIANHPSEQDINLHNKERTYVCENNGTIIDLKRKIANIIVASTY